MARHRRTLPVSDGRSRSILRCAIYTRKSSEEGLEQSFNSLHAQRDACESYVASQKHEGWRLLPDHYDDGGLSGGSMERPALVQLLDDIRSGLIDIVVVYKVDRLTRSLADFAKLTELFDAHGVSFVSVTQAFNTSTSMGRLTLNVLLSFAQFEREVAGERIRDKIALSKRRGMWMGGLPPLGYDGIDRKLIVNPAEAETVRLIYEKYLELSSVAALKHWLDAKGIVSKQRQFQDGRVAGGMPISRGALYQILRNRLYRGEIAHRDEIFAGNHAAIIEPELWDAVQARLTEQGARPRQTTPGRPTATQDRAANPSALLTDLVFDAAGQRLTPHFAVKKGKRYHYYVSAGLVRGGRSSNGIRVPAADLENLIIHALQSHLSDPAWLCAQIDHDPDASWTQRLFAAALELGQALSPARLAPREVESDCRLRAITQRIIVGDRRIEIVLERDALTQILCEIDPNLAQPASSSHDAALTIPQNSADPDSNASRRSDHRNAATIREDTITITVDARALRCGKQVKLIVGDVETDGTRINPPLLKLVSDAFRWFDDLKTGRCTTIAQIAARERRQVSEVSRSISLAFLAPDIVDQILEGRQPITLTPERLKACRPLPLDWVEQRQLLLIDV
jgi:DNA invertase Pin-like site-specific DNA recombinase